MNTVTASFGITVRQRQITEMSVAKKFQHKG